MKKALRHPITKIFPDLSDEVFHLFLNYLSSSKETLKNLTHLKLKKPYGYNNILRIEGNFGFSFVELQCGQASSEHFHEHRKEFFIVKKGTLTLLKNGKKHLVSQGQWDFSTPLVPHSIENASSSEELEILEIFSPPLLDDKIRVKDRYERKIGKVFHQE